MLPFCPNDFDDNNITKIAARAEESRQLARVHTLRAQDKDRRRYDSKHQMVSYAHGHLVWVYATVLDESRSFFRVHTGYFSNIGICIHTDSAMAPGATRPICLVTIDMASLKLLDRDPR
ncbi:transposon Ty3-I Gag-Pol polyprotein [Trichonephila clavipes]|nr:transposon Ty3-I Gag-Pol polyprotein [Trichonephila clavipes]